MLLGNTFSYSSGLSARPVQYVELLTQTVGVTLMLSDATSANHVLTGALGYSGPCQGPRSERELEESPGLWACCLPPRALDSRNLNEILTRPLGLWYFRPNCRAST